MPPHRRAPRRAVRAAALAAASGCAVVVAICGELSAGAHVAVLAAGLVVAAQVLRHPARRPAPAVGPRGLPWLVWAGAAAGWELAALASADVPTISDLLDPALASPVVRAAATLAWLAAGVGLLARPREEVRP